MPTSFPDLPDLIETLVIHLAEMSRNCQRGLLNGPQVTSFIEYLLELYTRC